MINEAECRAGIEGGELCGSPRIQGSETILCRLDSGHDKGEDATWHEAVVTDHREMDFGTAHIVADTREVISWEPFGEKVRRGLGHLGQEAPRD